MTLHKSFINIVVITVLAAISSGIWAYFNRPVPAPDWPDQISGFSYSPYRGNQRPGGDDFPTDDQIREDLTTISTFTEHIRIYAASGNMQRILPIAEELGLSVVLGIWLDEDLEHNALEITAAIESVEKYRNIRAIYVGNETMLHDNVSKEALIMYLDAVRSVVKIPVSTAQPWHVWKDHTELAKHVDVIAAHVLPYWEKMDAEHSVAFVLDKAKVLHKKFRKKPIILAEVGWPSHGRDRGDAAASQIEQAVYLRNLVNQLNSKGYKYFVIEAFDQPWKASEEGDVGAYWGIFNADRQHKFNLEGDLVKTPRWRTLAAASIILAILALTIVLIDSSGLRQTGRTFLASIAFIFASFLVFVGYDYSKQYLTWFEWMMGIFLVLGSGGVFVVLFTEAHEFAEAVWMRKRRREFKAVTEETAYRPKVSVHVPCYNEPPEMVKLTLDALANLDYPDYEVIVIDNNTKDENVWKPVEEYCKTLGSKFRFFHESPLAGYKAGALNFSLEKTAADAEVIAVIDSDYCVERLWLKHLVPHFENLNIAVVQTPQDYRDSKESLFKTMCYAEYKGFFHIGMITRNDRDAIIQHGTMTMIRKNVMQELGWAQWCITEDAELGLRVFQKGLSAAYISDSYGKGLMPDRFIDFKKQRFRWAYGAMQILKRHSNSLLKGNGTKLTRGQRYHFIAGWLPWMADGLNLFFTVGALMWSAAMLIAPTRFMPPALIFAIPPLLLFLFKIGKILFLYRYSLKINTLVSIGAAIAGLALSHTIAKAVIYGTLTNSMPFFRTPKNHHRNGFWDATIEAREELFFLILLVSAITSCIMLGEIDTWDAQAWILMLAVQSLSYLAAIIMALISSAQKVMSDSEESTSDADKDTSIITNQQ